MKLKIEQKDGDFVVTDEKDVVYGPSAATRKEAEEILKNWKAYYAEKT